MDLVRLRQARDRMDREYAEPLDVPKLAREALMSTRHFARSFREAFGETPYSYLMTRRIERAKALLRRGELSVTEVCVAVGCTSLGSFSSRFTELVGESPSAYRAREHDFSAVPGLDTSAVLSLVKLRNYCEENGVTLGFSGLMTSISRGAWLGCAPPVFEPGSVSLGGVVLRFSMSA